MSTSLPTARPLTSPTGVVLSRSRARAAARAAVPPRLGAVVVLSVVVAAAFPLAPAMLRRTASTPLVVALAAQQHSVTVLTRATLAMTAVLALVALGVSRRGGVRAVVLWSAAVLVPAAVIADAVTPARGRLAPPVTDALGAVGVHLPVGPVRSADAVLLLAGGGLAGVLAIVVRGQVLRYRRLLTMSLVTATAWAAAVGAPTALRQVTHSISLPLVAEESLHAVAAVLGALTVLTGLVAARTVHRDAGALARRGPRIGPLWAVALTVGVGVMVAASAVAVILRPAPYLDVLPYSGAVVGAATTAALALRLTRSRRTAGTLAPAVGQAFEPAVGRAFEPAFELFEPAFEPVVERPSNRRPVPDGPEIDLDDAYSDFWSDRSRASA